MKHTLIIIIILFAVNTTVLAQSSPLIQQTEKATDSMVFLTYHISKTSKAASNLEYKKTILAKGRIKGFHAEKALNKKGNLVCELLDADLNVIENLYIENPLEKIIEFVNDSGDLEKRSISLDKTDFTFRMPYTSAAKFVRMHIIANSDTINYIMLKL
ncbi:hypothetical protein [Bizionia myxarmorum]|uniref:Uncharacterized protein n=1 Tax=Bizionia myxarmorum TaxID=291186 RepID=A0A5D0RFJ3_9FLAO|nr:hypothetical protein [Bizionia myxarmorum]TYB79324.1 hypothetical protein ES674_06000 [Bizionia myxarmorum]